MGNVPRAIDITLRWSIIREICIIRDNPRFRQFAPLLLLQCELLEVNDNVQGEQISIESDNKRVVLLYAGRRN